MKIDKVNQISTGVGDKGTSINFNNIRYSKDDILFEVLGTIDELSSVLGICFQVTNYEEIKVIQRTLQDINSLIATSVEEKRIYLTQIKQRDIEYLEEIESKYLKTSHITHEFVLPGSESKLSAFLDLARTVTRRSERRLVTFIDTYNREDLSLCLVYLNRLSDLLFIMARQKKGK